MSLHIKVTPQPGYFPLQIQQRIPAAGITALFGPSGCGKSSLLSIIAGLDKSRRAEVLFGGETWQSTKHWCRPEQRRIGLMLQHPSLLPHLSVADNILFGYRRVPPGLRYVEPDEVITELGLAALMTRRVTELSGGQQQRVALARALLSQSRLLLLDEPLSGLDQHARGPLLQYLRYFSSHYGVPVIWVSHDLDDVVQIADHLVQLEQGRVASAGPLTEQLRKPPLLFTGGMSILQGKAKESAEAHQIGVELGTYLLAVPAPPGRGLSQPGASLRMRVLARDVSLSKQQQPHSSAANQLPATIIAQHAAAHPAECLVALDVEGQHLLALITRSSWKRLQLAPGEQVYAVVKAVALH
ncbi:molybdenum ABC transporter ATP-binding protein [Pseudidiomarina sp.]|uniref:molybdenum ABC transporter ATP-binding protein n=1 Tax=Pseudidiomarina sp. TaxID=2081707 RepID=UPI00299D6701|nr:molybdenum ABC transporter ATP-binding protein [Pseudidiomarina sp.]MDX1705907.1 molybdenum ABC transporter ATP-binding protein [Pseudidiomarina sp.]